MNKKDAQKWFEDISKYLDKKCDEYGMGFVFMPFVVAGKVKKNVPSGLVVALPKDYHDAAAAAILARMYRLSALKEKISFKKWVKMLAKAVEQVGEEPGAEIVEK